MQRDTMMLQELVTRGRRMPNRSGSIQEMEGRVLDFDFGLIADRVILCMLWPLTNTEV